MSKNIHTQTAPAIFQFNSNEIRTISQNGEPWFVAKDVCDVLEIKDHKKAVVGLENNLLTAGIKGAISNTPLIATKGGAQKVTVLNEYGLNMLTMRSRKPVAIKFQYWIASEVLPSIRKTGSYTLKINDEQQQVIKDLINRVASETGLPHAGLYPRLHNKFKIPRYQELPAAQFDEAVAYLQAKLPKQQMFYGLQDGRYLLHINGGQTTIKDMTEYSLVNSDFVYTLKSNMRTLGNQLNILTGEVSPKVLDTPMQSLPGIKDK